MRLLRFVAPFLAITIWVALAPLSNAQSTVGPSASSSTDEPAPTPTINSPRPNFVYVRPTEQIKFRKYLFDSFGPYPIVGAALVAGIDQADKTPPEWGQGAQAYGQRVGSDFGIALVTTTTRYALAEALREDTVYYRCECSGVFHRMRHALISTVTARRGEDGHRTLSFPSIVAPYAGTFTAVYGWYPQRYDAKDALRMGNYYLLALAGENVALEFIYGGPHTVFKHFHRDASTGSESTTNH